MSGRGFNEGASKDMQEPIVSLITDRRRLTPETGWPSEPTRAVLDQVRAAVEAGIGLVQIRERDLAAGALLALVVRVVEVARGTATRIVVNDRLDVALAAGAAGVHLREDSIPTERARSLAPPGFLIGRSVHDVEGAARAGTVDYLTFGTVYPSASKPDRSGAGVAGLQAVAAVARAPVLAVGGVTVARAPEVAAAGGAGIAAIGAFVTTAAEAASALRTVREDLQRVWRAL